MTQSARVIPLHAQAIRSRLQELGIAQPQQIAQAQEELTQTGERFSAILVRLGVFRDIEGGRRLAVPLGILPQRFDSKVMREMVADNRIPANVWRTHRLVPLHGESDKVLLATDDPLSVFALPYFERQCGLSLEVVLVREQDLITWLTSVESVSLEVFTPALSIPQTTASPIVSNASKAAEKIETPVLNPPVTLRVSPTLTPAPTPSPVASPPAPQRPQKSGVSAEDEPIIRLVDSMMSEAVRMRSSDVHIQPGRDQLGVRYRIDGILHDVNSPPKALQGPIVSRIKILGGLNIAEKRLPQDGRLQLSIEGKPLDVRISTLPSMHGESIVMRLLDRSQPIRGLAEMGLHPDGIKQWEELISRPHGMVLVTGPTGSGKTTTLYGALAKLNRPDRKLITVEDPVEYQLVGVNQVAVKATIGLTFAAALRSMLRQAPDIIMVGEIRDQETAQVAIQAALTGHLVLSTLHTNDAPSAITRLIDMGIAPFLVASTIQGVLAQRLVRRICPDCCAPETPTPEERSVLESLKIEKIMRGKGCPNCHGSGFSGRIGIFELLQMTDTIRRLVVTKASASVIRTAAKQQGMGTLQEDGFLKVREGLTSVGEVFRVVAGSSE